MTKTICDVCGKEIPSLKLLKHDANFDFNISSPGKLWDVCSECRAEFKKWVKERRSK